jgi:hypothetical protein
MPDLQEQAWQEGQPDQAGQYAIVELMGRKVIAGRVQQDVTLGPALMRVDVPATSAYPAYSAFYGTAAIYCVTVVSEDVARRAAESWKVNPVSVYAPELVTRQEHETAVDRLQQQIARMSRGLPAPDDGNEETVEEDVERRR